MKTLALITIEHKARSLDAAEDFAHNVADHLRETFNDDGSLGTTWYRAEPDVEHKTYTLAELRNGTGFPRGARFRLLP